MVKLPAWPQGRDLRIDSSQGKALRTGVGVDPAPVRVYRHDGNYFGIEYGQPVAVRRDGDAFFRAVLISVGQAQAEFAEGLSPGKDRSEEAVIVAMREHLARYVLDHRDQVASLLHAWSIQTCSSP